MERKLASIQKIVDVKPIENADAIEKVQILGWQCVSRKNEFKPGDLAIYFEIDSFLPIDERYEFLRKSSHKILTDGREGFRLRTIKLRKTLSQGLLLSLKEFPEIVDAKEGQDVTEILKIEKYEPPIPTNLSGQIFGKFPTHIVPKTDEIRVQSIPTILDEMKDRQYYITTKVDGTSSTFYYKDGHFGVCGRNWEYKEDETNTYWKIAKKYKLKELMEEDKRNIAIQGEIVGPGIQKNPLLLKELEIRVFSVYLIDEHQYASINEAQEICESLELPFVPIDEMGDSFNYTLDELLEKAKGKYKNTDRNREGIVIRPQIEAVSVILEGRMSFKVINNDFLLGNNE